MTVKTSMSVSVPAPMVDEIDERASELGFLSRSEYVRALIDADTNEDTEQLPDELLAEVKA